MAPMATDNFTAEIKVGMHITIRCTTWFGLRYNHDAIVVSMPDRPCGADKIKVIHFAYHGPETTFIVREETLEHFLSGGSSPRIVDAVPAQYAPGEVVARARSRLGEKHYNLFSNNCQHFAHWCCVDDPFSREVYTAFASGAAVGLAVTCVCVAGMAAAKGYFFKRKVKAEQ